MFHVHFQYHFSRDRNVIRSMDRGIQAAQQTMQYVVLYLIPTLVEALAVVASAGKNETFFRFYFFWNFWKMRFWVWVDFCLSSSGLIDFRIPLQEFAIGSAFAKNYHVHVHDSAVLQLQNQS